MKNKFFEYRNLELPQIEALWKSATFVLDTNVLLNLYRYSENTSEKLLGALLTVSDRIWLPYQVGFEFHENRLSVITDQAEKCEEFMKSLDRIIAEIENKNRNPFLASDLTKKVSHIKNEIDNELSNKIDSYRHYIKKDPILEKLDNIFCYKIGEEYTPEKLDKIFKEGEGRYKKRIPPGYEDAKKNEDKKFGDLIIWYEIINYASTNQCDIIFILDDKKEDWWLKHQGMIISPRPELLKEFNIKTGKQIHLYRPFQFLEYFNSYQEDKIQKETIEEVKNYTNNSNTETKSLEFMIKFDGEKSHINRLISQVEDSGYQILQEISESKTHTIVVALPDIPDLERRFLSKFIFPAEQYGLTIMNISYL